jgi:DNA-directed RNA polymerase subunit RPC12/RpoP
VCLVDSSTSVDIDSGEMGDQYRCADCNNVFRGMGKKIRCPSCDSANVKKVLR